MSIEVFLLVNLAADLTLLCAAARCSGCFSWRRTLAAALLAVGFAVVAALFPLPHFVLPAQSLLLILVSMLLSGRWDFRSWSRLALLLCEGESREGDRFPMTFEMKRMAPGCGNTVEYEIYGMKMSAKFSTEDPNALHYTVSHGQAQAWARLPVGQKTLYPVITGGIFEFGFSDSLLQMFAAYVSEMKGLPCSFGCFTPEEAKKSHELLTAALTAYEKGVTVTLP